MRFTLIVISLIISTAISFAKTEGVTTLEQTFKNPPHSGKITVGLKQKKNDRIKGFGDIPVSRLSATKWQNFEWDSSGNWETIDVTQEGIVPDATTDIAPKVMAIIANGSGKRILKFPAGTFHIKSRLKILKGDIQIVGEGKATKFILQGGGNAGYITVFGGESGDYKLSADASRGDSIVTLTSTSGLNVGDYFIVKQGGSLKRPDADPAIGGDETQIFRIIAKSGNELSLDMKFGIPFFKEHTTVRKMSFLKNIRFHNFYIERPSTTSGDGDVNIYLRMLQNAEFSNIESKNARKTHIALFNSRDVIFFQNYLHGNFGCDKCGGYQYGISLVSCTKVNLINNRGSDLRHFFISQFGTNHCVFAYNRAEPPYNHYGDIGQHNSKGCHNNLFEGNYGNEIFDDGNARAGWGTRYTMWFRNHAITQVGSTSPYVEHMTIIGNELESEDGETTGIRDGAVGVPGEDTFSGANVLNVSPKGEGGTIVWGDMRAEDYIPASLFLNEKPEYLNKWPLYGPPVSLQASVDGIIENKVSLFPNPTTGIVHLSEVKQWEVFSISGTLLNFGESNKVDFSGYKNGLYLVGISGNFYKVIKKK